MLRNELTVVSQMLIGEMIGRSHLLRLFLLFISQGGKTGDEKETFLLAVRINSFELYC